MLVDPLDANRGAKPSIAYRPNDHLDEFRIAWRVLLAGLIGTMFGAPGLVYYSIGMFAPSLVMEFAGLTR